MDDSRPLFAADAAQIVDMVEQRVDERSARVSRSRVDDHPCGFVDDDHIAILIEDRKRKRLRLRLCLDRLRYFEYDDLPGLDRLIGFGHPPGDPYRLVLDQPL